jgi:protoporphyrinogen oxidase
MKKKIGIVGGGMLGMTLAFRLSQAGFEVSIIESAPELGGLASSCQIGKYVWDRFYHVFLKSDSNLLGLLEEFNLLDQINWGQTKTGFFTDGRFYSMSNILEFLSFPPLKFLDKFRLGLTIYYVSKIKSAKHLEQISVTEWLTRFSGQRTFNKIWLPLLKSKLGDSYNIVSASFIWAIISRMYAARKSGLKQEMFGYVNKGYSTIISKFQQILNGRGVKILCRTPVVRVVNDKDGIVIETTTKKSLRFDAAVITSPCSQIPGLCPQLSLSEKQHLNKVTYQGVLCATLILKRPLANYYITNITDKGVPFTAVIEMTSLVDQSYFDGNSLIYLPRYLTQEDTFWYKTEKDIEDEFLSALERMYLSFNRADVLHFHVSKANHVLPITTLNYSIKVLPPTKISLENVFIVNSAQIANGTMNVNEIIGLANRKATELVELLSV